MIHGTALKVVPVIAPVAIKDNASWTTIEIDTLGFGHCTVVFQLGATDIALAALKMQHSDTSGSGQEDIDDLDFSADSTLPTAGEDGLLFAFHIHLDGKKRYLTLVATAGDGSAGTFATAVAILTRGAKTPNSASERGFTRELFA